MLPSKPRFRRFSATYVFSLFHTASLPVVYGPRFNRVYSRRFRTGNALFPLSPSTEAPPLRYGVPASLPKNDALRTSPTFRALLPKNGPQHV